MNPSDNERSIGELTRQFLRAAKLRDAGAHSDTSISSPMSSVDLSAGIAPLIDHTLLKPEASRDEITVLCEDAKHFGFATVCVNPSYITLAAGLLRGARTKVCTVIGFPLGATLTPAKLFEARSCMELGAAEIDMVTNIGALKSSQYDIYADEIESVVELVHRHEAICKVILETALLNNEEKVRACLVCKHAGADFVKTSTGFSTGGATASDVALMRTVVGAKIGVKAAGGIRSLNDLRIMIAAGATRVGSSSSVRIMQELEAESRIR